MKSYNSSRRGLALALLAMLFSTSALIADNLPPLPSESISSITARNLKTHLSFLASDELGGRYSFSQGNRIAARYLAAQLESFGYRGAARDGSFLQKVPLARGAVDVSRSGLSLTMNGTRQEFRYETDYMLESPQVADIPEEMKGDLVFVGYGISSPKNRYDDYAGLDVRGRVVITVKGTPDSLKGVSINEAERGNAAARAAGAQGLIVISEGLLSSYETFSAGYAQNQYFRIAQSPLATPGFQKEDFFPQIVQAGPSLVKAIAGLLGEEESALISPNGRPLPPRAIPVTIEIKTRFQAEDLPPTYNVAGLLEGADPRLKDEYIVLGAHYDHLEKGSDGSVYNGADDNASGTAAVLEMARAFTVGPRPKRSVMVIFYTAEEIGLRGSKFFTDYEPLLPLENAVANFNLDMVGRSGADPADKDLTGKDAVFLLGAARRSTELYNISEETNAETVRLRLDHSYKGQRGLMFFRSDHYNFDRHGVPVIWYHTGGPPEYHKPADDIDKIDFEKMERIARLAFATGWRVANLDHRLVIDKSPASARTL
ncbi:MAG: M20/M25/M40 family metallo-hydrolase [Blastocatellia bacterium]|nr:M20/M25/M40 family metallo-hydrolase [Blastocatellia bacterium]